MEPDHASSPRKVTDAELRVLEVLWRVGPSTVRCVSEILYPDEPASGRTTVLKLLQRLEEKKLVDRDRSRTPQGFLAVVDRARFITDQFRLTALRFGNETLGSVLVQLLDAGVLGEEDVSLLRVRINGDPAAEMARTPNGEPTKRSDSPPSQPVVQAETVDQAFQLEQDWTQFPPERPPRPPAPNA